MEELFRFSVIRPAQRFNATAVSLERQDAPISVAPASSTAVLKEEIEEPTQSFQDQLRDLVEKLATDGGNAKSIWYALEPIALKFIKDHAKSILENSLWGRLNDFLTLIRQIIQNKPSDINSDAISRQFSDLQNLPGLSPYQFDLNDLFLALLIVRRGGPAHLNELIRAGKLWSSTDLLSSNPTLPELADRIRIIPVIKAGPDALVPHSPGKATPWKTGTDYKVGDLVTYKGKTYRCSQSHTSQTTWTPDVTPVQWQPITLPDPASSGDIIQANFDDAINKTLLFPPGIFSQLEKPIHSVGFRELHVVKQHIRRYEMKEIGQIENILKGESRAHTQKHTISNERDFTQETQTTTETDKEVTTTDHVDIKNEAEKQVKEDTKVDAGVHAQYDGGSFKIQADLTVSYDKSTDESKKYSSDVAKDVTQKATSKITQQVTQIQTTKIIETLEDTTAQSFDNKGGPEHVSGVYQWIEKVYLSQVFNLGRHMLLELMVPEPGAALLAGAKIATGNDSPPVPPDPLGTVKIDAKTQLPIFTPDGRKVVDKQLTPGLLSENASDPFYYGNWVANFQVSGVEPPPPMYLTVAKSISQKRTDDIGQLVANDVVQIADGYTASVIRVATTWLRYDPGNPGVSKLEVTVGAPKKLEVFHFSQDTGFFENKWENEFSGYGDKTYEDKPADPKDVIQGQLPISVNAVWVENVGVNIEVICRRAEDQALAKWQLATYEKIVAAWQKLEADYESKLADFKIDSESIGPLGGTNPDANRLIERVELKRQCIAIMDNSNDTVGGVTNVAVQDSADNDSKNDNSVWKPVLPEPILSKTQEIGANVLWFEQAFEWENMAYVSYPYFWGRRSTWLNRLNLENDDPLFVSFLQAGYARVLVPVRLGFELPVQVYLCTGLPWLGGAGIPPIGDKTQNPLYLDIAEEIKALTGGGEPGETETPVGDPWEYSLPTTLLKLRKDDALPEWHRTGPDGVEEETKYPSNEPDGTWSWRDGPPTGKAMAAPANVS